LDAPLGLWDIGEDWQAYIRFAISQSLIVTKINISKNNPLVL
jgi:hypothetical protein